MSSNPLFTLILCRNAMQHSIRPKYRPVARWAEWVVIEKGKRVCGPAEKRECELYMEERRKTYELNG